jgi:hypothetical protein
VQTTGADGRLRYGMTTSDVTPADGRYVTGVVEPESQPSSRTGSAHGPDGGFVAAPPAGRPNRGNVRRKTPDGRKTPDKSQSRRKAEGIFSYFPGDESAQPPKDEQPLSFEGNSEEEEGGGEEEGMQQRREEGWRPSMVTDTLGPKIVQGAHELTDMMTRQLDHWQQLHTLLQASLSERNQLMQTVARQEAQLEKLARERKEDAERHSQHVKDIYARMQREQQVPLSFSPSVPVSSLSLSLSLTPAPSLFAMLLLALPCARGAAREEVVQVIGEVGGNSKRWRRQPRRPNTTRTRPCTSCSRKRSASVPMRWLKSPRLLNATRLSLSLVSSSLILARLSLSLSDFLAPA